MHKREICVFVVKVTQTLFFAFVLLIAGCSDRWSDAKVEESKRRGNKVIVALQKYKVDNSIYPTSLGELVPKYVQSIDPPVAGNGKWQYYVYNDNKVFNLGFEDDLEDKPECWYSSKTKFWSCDTK